MGLRLRGDRQHGGVAGHTIFQPTLSIAPTVTLIIVNPSLNGYNHINHPF
jgi:hypothetical protein